MLTYRKEEQEVLKSLAAVASRIKSGGDRSSAYELDDSVFIVCLPRLSQLDHMFLLK